MPLKFEVSMRQQRENETNLAADQEPLKTKKRKAKEPNPLSCKKKKTDDKNQKQPSQLTAEKDGSSTTLPVVTKTLIYDAEDVQVGDTIDVPVKPKRTRRSKKKPKVFE